MAIYTGHWDQLPPNPRFPDQEATRYLRANRETNIEIRETLKTWCEYLATIAFSQADSIRYDHPQLTKSQAQKQAWATLDQAIRLNCDDPDTPIGEDPQVYSMEYTIKFCLKELESKKKDGKPKDVKKSIVDRHNWQVVHWAYAKFNVETQDDLTQEFFDWVDSRLIDVQTSVPATPSRAAKMLDSIFNRK